MDDEVQLVDSHKSRAKRHLRGWLTYAFASEVFVVVSLTMFLPICLEQFARDNGVLLPDKTEPCSSLNDLPPEAKEGVNALQCVVKIGWAWIDSASFSLYVYSISVALQALTVISVGSIVDIPHHRKRALVIFAAMGSIGAMLFLAVPSSSAVWFFIALFAIIANVGFGASVVAMNAYLPFLAKEDEKVVELREDIIAEEDAQEDAGEGSTLADDESPSHEAPLLSNTTRATSRKADYDTLVSQTTARISGTGIALGYFGGIVALILAMIPVTNMGGSTFALQLAIFASGVWWATFTVPASIWLPSTVELHSEMMPWSFRREIIASWRRLLQMLRWQEIMRLRHTFRFLGAWFLLSDGFTTITSTALLFGKTQLHMSATALILVGILSNASGILGALMWPRIQRFFRLTNKRVVIILVMLCSLIPVYGCFGFLPFFHDKALSDDELLTVTRFGGLTTQGEMFGLAIFFGVVYGAFQAYARALYAEIIPPNEAARWYALYSITDKSSSFVGPLVVGLIADATGNIRYAFFFLVAMIWVAVPLLSIVDVDRGREDARAYR